MKSFYLIVYIGDKEYRSKKQEAKDLNKTLLALKSIEINFEMELENGNILFIKNISNSHFLVEKND